MKVLVTGASGFLGRHVVSRCLEEGHAVRALVRPQSASSFDLRHERLQLCAGDLCDPPSVLHAVAGVRAVIHAAAKVSDWGEAAEFHAVNVGGTQAVVDACKAHAVERLVYVSTPSVVFDGGDQLDVDESQAYPARFCSLYAETKATAEQIVRLAARGSALKTVILRPHAIWGPGDTQGYFPRLMKLIAAGRLPRIGERRAPKIDLCHVRNAAQACVLALSADAAVDGTYFITDGQPVLLWEWVDKISDTFSLPRPHRSVGAGTAHLAAAVLELLWRLSGRARRAPPPLTRYAVRLLSHSSTYRIDAARRDLGYRPEVDVERDLCELREWVGRRRP